MGVMGEFVRPALGGGAAFCGNTAQIDRLRVVQSARAPCRPAPLAIGQPRVVLSHELFSFIQSLLPHTRPCRGPGHVLSKAKLTHHLFLARLPRSLETSTQALGGEMCGWVVPGVPGQIRYLKSQIHRRPRLRPAQSMIKEDSHD